MTKEERNNRIKIALIILGVIAITVILSLVLNIVAFRHTEGLVYRTKTGGCYHSPGCGYLWNSAIAMGYDQAKNSSLRICSRCGSQPKGTIEVNNYVAAFAIVILVEIVVFFLIFWIKSKKDENNSPVHSRVVVGNTANKVQSTNLVIDRKQTDFYRVSAIKKDVNTREIIIKTSSRSDAEKQVDKIKDFLFPNENTKDYFYGISEVPIVVNINTTIPHYRITVYRPPTDDIIKEDGGFEDFDDCYEWIESADSIEQAKAKMEDELLADKKNPSDYDIYADEMTVEQCIQEEEKSLKNKIRGSYFSSKKYDETLTVREYAKKQKEFDESLDEYYNALKEFNCKYRTRKHLLRVVDGNKISENQFEEYVKQLVLATGTDDYSKIYNSILEKYKK